VKDSGFKGLEVKEAIQQFKFSRKTIKMKVRFKKIILKKDRKRKRWLGGNKTKLGGKGGRTSC
jgi:hypothetical protein